MHDDIICQHYPAIRTKMKQKNDYGGGPDVADQPWGSELEATFADVAHAPLLKSSRPRFFCTSCAIPPCNDNMELLPAHQPVIDNESDEDLTDEQIRGLLNEAAARMRAKAAGKTVPAPNVPFKLPKLMPGHIADTHEKTEGNITRLDHSKLIDKEQQALANGIKKIEDPLKIKKQRTEVCTAVLPYSLHNTSLMKIIFPYTLLKQTRVPSWVPSCIIDA